VFAIKNANRKSAFLTVLALGLLLPAAPVAAQEDVHKSSPKVLAAFHDIVASVQPSVVRIRCNDRNASLGTIVGADGWVLTKASLLEGKPLVMLRDGRTLAAKVVGIDEPHDLALLKVEAKNLKAVQWNKSKDATPGDWAVSPGFDKEVAALGVVSVGERKMTKRDYPRIINPNGGFLGIMLAGPGKDEGGVKVGSVQKGTGAEKAGLKADDIILAVDGKKTPNPEALLEELGRHKVGQTVTIRLRRGTEEKELKATLGKRPADMARADIQNNMGSKLSDRRTGFPHILQHDSVLTPGECGGPLVEIDGKVVGINIARAGRTESYAIPSDTVLALLPELKSGKKAPTEVVKDDSAAKKIAELTERVKQAEKRFSDAEKKAAEARAALEKARAELKKAQGDVKK
jgi:serine protease Do